MGSCRSQCWIWHSLVSLTSWQSGLWLVTRLEMPIPHVAEHWVHSVVCGKHWGSCKTSERGNDAISAWEHNTAMKSWMPARQLVTLWVTSWSSWGFCEYFTSIKSSTYLRVLLWWFTVFSTLPLNVSAPLAAGRGFCRWTGSKGLMWFGCSWLSVGSLSSSLMLLSSSHTHSSQQPPSGCASRGFEHRHRGRGTW